MVKKRVSLLHPWAL